MEINRSDTEKPQKIVWSTSDGQEVGQVRSYQCSFCKRGFSNAQALGGHMNIHRKDRARLKGSYDEILVSTDNAKKNLSSSPPASPDDDMLQPESSDHKRPWIFSEKDESESPRKNCSKEVVQLPLFAEKSSTSTHFGTSSCADGHVEKSEQSDQSSSSLELDLELRLGPEPHD